MEQAVRRGQPERKQKITTISLIWLFHTRKDAGFANRSISRCSHATDQGLKYAGAKGDYPHKIAPVSKYWSIVKWTTGLFLLLYAQNSPHSHKKYLTPATDHKLHSVYFVTFWHKMLALPIDRYQDAQDARCRQLKSSQLESIYSLIAFNERVSFWLQCVRSLPSLCVRVCCIICV